MDESAFELAVKRKRDFKPPFSFELKGFSSQNLLVDRETILQQNHPLLRPVGDSFIQAQRLFAKKLHDELFGNVT